MLSVSIIAAAAAERLIALGGGLYEVVVINPVWPGRPDIIQPAIGGISRKRFWIPVHAVFELLLAASLILSWDDAAVRMWLFAGLSFHVVMRLWSAFDFIPKALRFERADPELDQADALRWTRSSLWRLPLDGLAAMSVMIALINAVLLAI